MQNSPHCCEHKTCDEFRTLRFPNPRPLLPNRFFRRFMRLAFLAAILLILVVVGCGPSEEELARRKEFGKQLIGRWSGGKWTVEFAADGSYRDKRVLDESSFLSKISARRGEWKIIRLDGQQAVVSITCKKSDVHGYWVGESETVSYSFRVEPLENGLRFESGWANESWVELSPADPPPEEN